MNIALKINSIVDALWPQPNTHPDPQTIQRHLQAFNDTLAHLSTNELCQILELSSHKALLMILQKCDIIISTFPNDKKQLLIEIHNFFTTWLHPTFRYNLKRSYDQDFIQPNVQRSISRFIGKILKQITLPNLQCDWEFIANYLSNLGSKSNYFEVLVISGYFDEVESMEGEGEDQEMMGQYFKNFEYEVISKVIKLAIKNVSYCKETLEMLEIEHMQGGLSINGSDSFDKGMMPGTNSNFQEEGMNSAIIKFLKYNFELIKKVINFNYDFSFRDPSSSSDGHKNWHCLVNDKCTSFPDYIIKPILEDVFLTELYEIASLLLNFKVKGSQARISFADIILELINKIIKTRILSYQTPLKQKFITEVLNGQSQLMKVVIDTSKKGSDWNLILKILKGNLKLLKNTFIVDLILFDQAKDWLQYCFQIVQFVMECETQLTLETYLAYKAMCLCKQIVYQTIIYDMNCLHQGYSRDIVTFGLNIQQIFVTKFINDSVKSSSSHKSRIIVQCYSLEDMKEKRDRYFLNIKILSQIYLPVFNNLMRDMMLKVDSLQKASKLLFLMSYVTNEELLSPSSFYYMSKNEDLENFKKIAIGNCYILISELFKQFEKGTAIEYQIDDSLFLYLEKILKLHLDDEEKIKTNLMPNEVLIKSSSSTFPQLNKQSKLVTAYFTWMLKIIRIKIEKYKEFADIESYFKIFIEYLKMLVEDNVMEEKFEIVSIQCELIKELLELRNSCRLIMPLESRNYFSVISLLLHQEPGSTGFTSDFSTSMIQSEVKGLLESLEINPNDWMGTCYEIGGFLSLIDEEKAYMKTMEILGVQFIDRICQSCVQNPNIHKIRLFTYFTNAIICSDEQVQIVDFSLWFPYLKPIFIAWTECFKIMCSSELKDDEQNFKSFDFLSNFLSNKNIKFYLIQRSPFLKDILPQFAQGIVNYLGICLDVRMDFYEQKDVKVFKVLKILFQDFSEYFWVEEQKGKCKGFFGLISTMVIYGKNEFKSINSRRNISMRSLLAVGKCIKGILDELYKASYKGKYHHKPMIADSIGQYLDLERNAFMDLQKQIDLARQSLRKYSKGESQKVKQSDILLLAQLSQMIYDIFKDKSQKGEERTMESLQENESIGELERDMMMNFWVEEKPIDY